MNRDSWTRTVGPIGVEIDFYLARPAAAPKSRMRPDRRPDLDKLVRSTLDAITTAGAIDDDVRVVDIVARKHYAHSRSGARIVLAAL
jgi:Holliday junction resolvase RusA-like endonuclease